MPLTADNRSKAEANDDKATSTHEQGSAKYVRSSATGVQSGVHSQSEEIERPPEDPPGRFFRTSEPNAPKGDAQYDERN